MFRLAVCVDTVFLDLPFAERVERIVQAGFLVEFWRWQGRDIAALAAAATVYVSAFTGDDGGSLVHPDGLAAFVEGVERTIPIAHELGCHEPGTGELNYAYVVDALRAVGYTGAIGLEAFPAQDSSTALTRFQELFS